MKSIRKCMCKSLANPHENHQNSIKHPYEIQHGPQHEPQPGSKHEPQHETQYETQHDPTWPQHDTRHEALHAAQHLTSTWKSS